MRISDWSSDVCSSDLLTQAVGLVPAIHARDRRLASLKRLGAAAEWALGTTPRATVEGWRHCPGNRKQGIFEAPGMVAARPAVTPITPGPEAALEGSEKPCRPASSARSEEHTSELQSLMRISYAVFCSKK